MAFYTALSTLITRAANFIIVHYSTEFHRNVKNNMKKKKIQFTEFAQYLMKIDK